MQRLKADLFVAFTACLKACPDTNLAPHSTITEHGNELGFGLPVQYDCKFDHTRDYKFGRGSS